ncbi:aspartic peptidase domain-containing protein [Parasitella parasitica]|nr:aspartic peptidase domain-containing protein [Parasitella parasitica]
MKRFVCPLVLLAVVAANALEDGQIKLPIFKHPTAHLTKRAEDIPLYNTDAREYIVEIGLGTPVQKFNFTLDTASPGLWVSSSQCSPLDCLYSRFAEKESSTLKQTNNTFDIPYGNGSAKGLLAYDTISFGNLTSANHIIGLANATSYQSALSSSTRVSGVLGLGIPGISGDSTEPTFVEQLSLNKAIGKAMFAIYFNRQDKHGETGKIAFGGFHEEYITRPIFGCDIVDYNKQGQPNIGKTYTNTTGDKIYKYWTVPGQTVAAYASNSSKVGETDFVDVAPAILDSGTTLSYLPQKDVVRILETITKDYVPLQSDGGPIRAYQVNCSDFTKQKMWFDFQLTKSPNASSTSPGVIRVPLRELVLPQNTDDLFTATTCIFGLAPTPKEFLTPSGTGWILGQTVLRSTYILYDIFYRQVVIMEAKNNYDMPILSLSNTNHGNVKTH